MIAECRLQSAECRVGRNAARSLAERVLLHSALCILHSALVSVPPATAQQSQLRMTIETLSPGLYLIHGYANGNILVIEGSNELLLVDAQSDRRVGLADSALRTITSKPVRQVIFTHYHDDHTWGMPHWRQTGARAVGHGTLAWEMGKDTTITDWENWHRTPAPAGSKPDLGFTDSLEIQVDDKRVLVYHIPPAHTNGDAIVYLSWANLLHTGDLVEPGAPPFIDYWVGGSLDGMIRAADRILAIVNDQTRIVPGHGSVVDRKTVVEHRRMLVTLRERIGAAIKAGKTLEQIQADAPAREFEGLLGGPRGATRFVRVVHYGLAREARVP